MAAITWKQLVGDSDTGAFKAIAAAGDSFTSGFEAFNKVIAARQAANQYGYNKNQDAQALAYRELVGNAGSEQGIADAKAQRDQMLAGLDPTRRALLLGAEESRLKAVRQNMVDAQVNKDYQTEITTRDRVNQAITTSFKSGKDEDRIAALNSIADLAGVHPKFSEIAKAIAGNSMAVGQYADQLLSSQSQRAYQGVQGDVAKRNATSQEEQVKISQQNADTQKKDVDLRAAETLEKRLRDTTIQRSGLTGGLTSPDAQAKIEAFLKNLPEGDRGYAQTAIGRLATNPKYTGMPVEAALLALRSDVSTGNETRKKWIWNGTGDNVEAAADKIMSSDGYKATVNGRQSAANDLTAQIETLKQGLGYVSKGTVGGAGGSPDNPYNKTPAQLAEDQRVLAELDDPTIDENGDPIQPASAAKGKTDARPPAKANKLTELKDERDAARKELVSTINNLRTPPAERRAAMDRISKLDQAYEQEFNKDSAKRAFSEVREMLEKGDVKALLRFQGSPLFDQLDVETKTQVFKAVNRR